MARSSKSFSVVLNIVSVVFCGVVLVYAIFDAQQFIRQHQQVTSEWIQSIATLPIPTPITARLGGDVAGVSVATPSAEVASLEVAQLIRIVDGDTIKVKLNGEEETVRLVGINTPESVAPQRPVECMGKEAATHLSNLVKPDQLLFLENDETQSNRDRYSRLLRFVFTQDQTDIGLNQIENGFAQSALYSSRPHKYFFEYQMAEITARENQLGLWETDVCQ